MNLKIQSSLNLKPLVVKDFEIFTSNEAADDQELSQQQLAKSIEAQLEEMRKDTFLYIGHQKTEINNDDHLFQFDIGQIILSQGKLIFKL